MLVPEVCVFSAAPPPPQMTHTHTHTHRERERKEEVTGIRAAPHH